MDINISEANQFINLHAHPQDVTRDDLSLINYWISKYPYSQSLKFLAAQATKESVEAEDNLAKAATFASNREVLFQFVNQIAAFDSEVIVLDESVNYQKQVLAVTELQNDLGQAFGVDLNEYKVSEGTNAVNDDNSAEIAAVENEIQEGELDQEKENIKGENIEEIAGEGEEVQSGEPLENVEEENAEEVTVVEENNPEEEPVQKTENIEEEAVAEEQDQKGEPETESIEEIVEERNLEEIAVIEKEIIVEETVQEAENVEKLENIEEEAVAEERDRTDELETESIEEIVEKQNVEEVTALDEDITDKEQSDEQVENIEEENDEEVAAVEQEDHIEELVQETENVEEQNSEEIDAEERYQIEETETENIEEIIEEQDVEEIAVAEEDIKIEEAILETENVEETISEEQEIVAVERHDHIEEAAQKTENVEEENIEQIAVAKETEDTEEAVSEDQAVAIAEDQTGGAIPEIENIEKVLSEKTVEEPDVTEEKIPVEQPVKETENTEDVISEDQAVAIAEDQTGGAIPEIENIEKVLSEKTVEEPDVTEEKIPVEQPVKETENTEDAISEDQAVAVAEDQTGEVIPDIENIDEVVSDKNNEEIGATEEAIKQASAVERTEKEEIIFDSPVASDFFAFAKSEKPTSSLPVPEPQKIAKEEQPKEKIKEDISQYNDERLPYTFLWWLNKTRKEHASNTQPYVKVANSTLVKTEGRTEPSLNHQIAENIFHLRGVDEISNNKRQNQTIPFDFRKKEFNMIEKFIKEEPQIKPPAANKIDTENKAKKSSEDANQVVSETLAKIYVEQMLYHKALDVYKKLSLKYPEKSTYFASQIKYLELKVN